MINCVYRYIISALPLYEYMISHPDDTLLTLTKTIKDHLPGNILRLEATIQCGPPPLGIDPNVKCKYLC